MMVLNDRTGQTVLQILYSIWSWTWTWTWSSRDGAAVGEKEYQHLNTGFVVLTFSTLRSDILFDCPKTTTPLYAIIKLLFQAIFKIICRYKTYNQSKSSAILISLKAAGRLRSCETAAKPAGGRIVIMQMRGDVGTGLAKHNRSVVK